MRPVLLRRCENSRLFAIVALMAAVPIGSAPAQQRAFSVKDDIAMVRFNDPSADINVQENESDDYSPDGKYVAVVTTRGLIATDEVRSEIRVFDLAVVERFLQSPSGSEPKPRLIASVTAISQGQQTIPYAAIIHDLRWSEDGKRIYFRGQNARGGYQLYEARTDGEGSHSLTPPALDVDHYDIAGDTVVYTASQLDAPPEPAGEQINRDAFDVTGVRSKDILFPGLLKPWAVKTFSMFTLHVGVHPGVARQVPGYRVQDNSFLHYLFPFEVSPDGQQVVSIKPLVGQVPSFWETFDPIPLFENRRLRAHEPDLIRPDNVLRPGRYTLTNLRSGASVILLDAPSAEYLGYAEEANLAVWSKDGTRVLLTNVYFPPDPSARQQVPSHTKPCAVASIDVPALRRRCIYFNDTTSPWSGQRLIGVRFGRDRDAVAVRLKDPTGTPTSVIFHLVEDAWTLDTSVDRGMQQVRQSPRDNVRVYMKQDLNEIPTLWASDVRKKIARQLWDPNPQLRELQFGQASVLRWKDPSGHSWIGGLVKPVGYVPGHRYPLVLQMYNFHPHEFLTDGTDPSAFTARHLASAGFVVLEMQKQPNTLSEQDPRTSLEGYQSAIERLSNEGLIDPDRVGGVGFSWTCWYVINALIKAPKLFAAATIADGLDNSYVQYILSAPSNPNLEAQMNQIKGGSPFGRGLDRWVSAAPGFHLDQVQAPVRIEAIGPDSILQELELYGSLYMQHKPVDMIYFPYGTHIHQMPLERLESQQGNVDWMRFWLQGYEDPDPAKRAQYVRWRSLRKELTVAPADPTR